MGDLRSAATAAGKAMTNTDSAISWLLFLPLLVRVVAWLLLDGPADLPQMQPEGV